MQYYVDMFDIGMRKIWEKPKILDCFVISRKVLTKKLIESLFLDSEKTRENEKRGSKEKAWKNKNFVYCLFNDREGKDHPRQFYIGKTTDLMSRQDNHKGTKDWWNTIILFTEKDDSFDETDIGAIERILFERYKACKSYILTNKQHPCSDIKEWHNSYVEYILSMLEHVGYELEVEDEAVESTDEYVPECDDTLVNKLNAAIMGINKTIQAEPRNSYVTYIMMDGQTKNYLCTVAPKSKETYCRVEFFTSVDKLTVKHDFVRKEDHLHNRACSMNVANDSDIKNMVAIIRDIIGYKPIDGQEKQGKRASFKFSMIGIKPGEVLVFKRDESKTCKVVDDTHVEFEGQHYSLSALACKLRNQKNAPQGPNEFKYNGVVLEELRKQKYGK